MKFEDAFYFKILLQAGLTDGYDEWLDGFLEAEDPLSDIVLKLALCGSDTRQTISCLHNYCLEQNIDTSIVRDKLRLFLKDAYYTNRLSKEKVASLMCRFVLDASDSRDINYDLWGDMYFMDDYYSLAKDGIITWENFDQIFLSFLNDGVSPGWKSVHYQTKPSPNTWLEKIKSWFCKKR